VIPEFLNPTSHGLPKRANKLFAFAQTLFPDRAREMRRERSHGQPGTIGIGPVEPQLNAPDGLSMTLEQPRQDLWRCLVAGDAVKTECDERVAQRCGEPARLAPVQKRERGMFLLLHNAIGKPGRLFVGLGSASGKTSPALLVQSDNFSLTNSVTGSNPPERVESGATSTATSTRGVNRVSKCENFPSFVFSPKYSLMAAAARNRASQIPI
jgi:hypothetical protein